MTSEPNTLLAPVLIDARLRTAQNHRSRRAHTYSMPVVREIPRPVASDAVASSGW
jgi:hypothetical protein